MTGPRQRAVFNDFNEGIFEPAGCDSSRLSRKTLRSGKNIRINETGGLTGRNGITSRGTGLPANGYSVFEFRSNAAHALIASNGSSIRVLDNAGWSVIGSFPSAGTRSSAAMMNGRMYLANGLDRLRVVDFISGSWNVRAAGVDAPSTAPTLAAAGGSGTAYSGYRIAYSYVDNRGFESNVGPSANVQSRANDTITVSGIVAGGATISFINIYSSISNQSEMFFVKQVANPTASTTIDSNNLSRDEALSAPIDHNIPPNAIFSLFSHKNRMYAARYSTFDTFYLFTSIGEPEYWPNANRQDLVAQGDPSKVSNFTTCSLGLMPYKDTSILLLEGDPETQTAPQVVLQGAGLAHVDALMSLNGVSMSLTQRGFVGHDGVRPFELWRRIQDTSEIAIAASRVVASFKDTRILFFFRDENAPSVAKAAAFDLDDKRWLIDEWTLVSGQLTTTDTTRDFAEDADVSLHENVENGAQTIASGGGTSVITLSGANSAKLVAGVLIKFAGSATVFQVTNVTGVNITLNGTAPADTTAVDYIRGTIVTGGKLTLAGGS